MEDGQFFLFHFHVIMYAFINEQTFVFAMDSVHCTVQYILCVSTHTGDIPVAVCELRTFGPRCFGPMLKKHMFLEIGQYNRLRHRVNFVCICLYIFIYFGSMY